MWYITSVYYKYILILWWWGIPEHPVNSKISQINLYWIEFQSNVPIMQELEYHEIKFGNEKGSVHLCLKDKGRSGLSLAKFYIYLN